MGTTGIKYIFERNYYEEEKKLFESTNRIYIICFNSNEFNNN